MCEVKYNVEQIKNYLGNIDYLGETREIFSIKYVQAVRKSHMCDRDGIGCGAIIPVKSSAMRYFKQENSRFSKPKYACASCIARFQMSLEPLNSESTALYAYNNYQRDGSMCGQHILPSFLF